MKDWIIKIVSIAWSATGKYSIAFELLTFYLAVSDQMVTYLRNVWGLLCESYLWEHPLK